MAKSKYRPDFPARVREHLAKGWSQASAAAMLGISKQTFYRWIEENGDFSDAVNEGMAACEHWWEDKGRTMAESGEIPPAVLIFNMKARFNWKDNSGLELTGRDGGPIETKTKVLNVIGVEAGDSSDTEG